MKQEEENDMSKTGKLVISIISVALLCFVYWLVLPPLSVAYVGGITFVAFGVLLLVTNIAMWVSDCNWETIGWTAFVTVVVYVVILFVCVVVGSKLFNAITMHQQLGSVEEIEFDDMIKQIDTSQIPFVDEELAMKQADKKIGEDPALGSRAKLGKAAIQEVNGEILYVIPLEHRGFGKWLMNRSTPGYMTVSASNPNKVNFITDIDGEKLNIQYQSSAYWTHNLKRHIRNEGYRNVNLTEYTFEIDDTGRPYWVVTTYKNHIALGCPEATGVVVVDAQNGKTEWWSVEDAPDWIDIIQPKSFIEDQIDRWGKYVHGFWNTHVGEKDMKQKTDLTLTVYMEGDCYYFTGMTSVGSDDSCLGFIMVNTRNKHAQICYMGGATEEKAMASAEGLVSNFGYKANEPLPVNINGIPTFVMGLKDEEGLNKVFAMVNIKNYNISAKGDTLAEASRAYLQKIASESSMDVVASDEAYRYTYEGKVERISNVVEDGSTYYYLVVEGEKDKIFTASYMVSEELSITRDGDTVKISYIDDKNGTVDIVAFDNIAFATPVSEEQEKRNELDEGTSALESDNNQIIEVNPEANQEIWDNLTDEEKAKMLEDYSPNNN